MGAYERSSPNSGKSPQELPASALRRVAKVPPVLPQLFASLNLNDSTLLGRWKAIERPKSKIVATLTRINIQKNLQHGSVQLHPVTLEKQVFPAGRC